MNVNCKPFFGPSVLSVFVALLLCQRIDGQNLVPNPSFEDVNNCAEFSQPCSPSAWFYLSRKLTTGYYPRYPSATGKRHLQIVAASRETANRQYWETMLLCPLQAGEKYTVSLKIAGPKNQIQLGTTCPNLRDIGFWFTTRFVFVQGDSILQPRSYLSFTNATTKDLKNGWFEVKKEFTATANASILIVGNFIRMENADIMDQRNWPTESIDVLVDDIVVSPVKGAICPGSQKVKDSLYAITWRHSESSPGEPDVAEEPRDPRKPVPDTLSRHPEASPPVDPLFGPEPRRVVDTPAPTQPMPEKPAAATDTIIMRNILFDFDKYHMHNPDTLQRYRRLFTRPDIKKIKVVGFTDEIGSEAYNKDLSRKRAHEIGRILATMFQLSPTLIETEGRGISRDYPTRDLNRRVEIYIFHN